jgi:hypothetical protein
VGSSSQSPASSPRQGGFTFLVPIVVCVLSYVGLAFLLFSVFYSFDFYDYREDTGANLFRVSFVLFFALVVTLSIASSLFAAWEVGLPLPGSAALVVSITALLSLPTLWFLALMNACENGPGPIPFGGGLSC